MAFFNDLVYDAALDYISSNCDKIHFCSQEPTTYTEAATTYTLGNKAAPTFSALADGDTDGRKLPVDEYVDGVATGTGTATHLALVDEGNSRLLHTVPITPNRGITSGDALSVQGFDIVFRDAT